MRDCNLVEKMEINLNRDKKALIFKHILKKLIKTMSKTVFSGNIMIPSFSLNEYTDKTIFMFFFHEICLN
jgi:hypothetical protein